MLITLFLAAAQAGVILIWLNRIETSVFVGLTALLLAGAYAAGFRLNWLRDLRPVEKQHKVLLALCLLVGAILRAPWSSHLTAGQDQGLYASYAQSTRSDRQLHVRDDFRNSLPPDLRQTYDNNEGARLPGTPWSDEENSTFEIAMYPLHPVLMGQVSVFTGAWHQGLLHVVAGILAIGALYFLARGLTLSSGWALAVAAFYAVHPLLVWTAKLPFTESLASLWILLAYLGLLRWLRSLHTETPSFSAAVFSLAAWNAFFYTRLSLPLHAPFLGLVALGGLTFLTDTKARRWWSAYWAIFAILVVLAFRGYALRLPMLFEASTDGMLRQIARTHESAARRLVFMCVALVAVWFSLHRVERLRRAVSSRLRRIQEAPGTFAVILLTIFLIVGIQSVTRGVHDPSGFWVEIWSPKVLSRSVPYRLFLWLTPPLLFGALWSAFRTKLKGLSMIEFTAVAMALILAVIFLRLHYVLYAYYADRYFTTEMIPAGILAGAILLRRLDHRAAVACFGLACVWNFVFVIPQIGRVEGDRMGFYDQVFKALPDRAVLAFHTEDSNLQTRLRLPLCSFDDRIGCFPLVTATELSAEFPKRLCALDRPAFLLLDAGAPLPYPTAREVSAPRLELGFFLNGPHGWWWALERAHPDVPPRARWLPPVFYRLIQRPFRLYDLGPVCAG